MLRFARVKLLQTRWARTPVRCCSQSTTAGECEESKPRPTRLIVGLGTFFLPDTRSYLALAIVEELAKHLGVEFEYEPAFFGKICKVETAAQGPMVLLRPSMPLPYNYASIGRLATTMDISLNHIYYIHASQGEPLGDCTLLSAIPRSVAPMVSPSTRVRTVLSTIRTHITKFPGTVLDVGAGTEYYSPFSAMEQKLLPMVIGNAVNLMLTRLENDVIKDRVPGCEPPGSAASLERRARLTAAMYLCFQDDLEPKQGELTFEEQAAIHRKLPVIS